MPKGGIRPTCSVANCGNPHKAKGFCGKHLFHWKKTQAVECSIDGCVKPAEKRSWCAAHYFRYRKHGDPLGGGVTPGTAAKFYEDFVLSHQDRDACLRWPFSLSNGYPFMNVYNGRRKVYVHRLVCENINGPPPTTNHEAAHNCGNSWCCNRFHVRWATPAENNADQLIHGTRIRGQEHRAASLTESDVRKIRLLKGTASQREIGKMFGVGQDVISRIVNRKAWAWLD